MDKYTKAVLTVVALSVLALPVKAEEKIWFCEIKQNYGVGVEHGIAGLGLDRFTMKVTTANIQFGDGGFAPNMSFPMIGFDSLEDWYAGHEPVIRFRFLNGYLSHVSQSAESVLLYLASCEDF